MRQTTSAYLLLVLLLVISIPAWATDTATASTDTASTETARLVGGLGRVDRYDRTEIDIEVLVRGQEDEPVTGLARDDFRILQDGTEMEISRFTAFTEQRFQPGPTAEKTVEGALPTDQGTAQDSVAEGEPHPIYLVIFIDNLNLRHLDRNRLLRHLQGFVTDVLSGPVQIMVVSHGDTLSIRQPFTNDQRQIVAALRELRTNETGRDERDKKHDEVQEEIRRLLRMRNRSRTEIDRNVASINQSIAEYAKKEGIAIVRSLQAINEIGAMLTGLDGRKCFLYLSNGFPLVIARDLLHELSDVDQRLRQLAITMAFNKKSQYDAAAAAANAQGIALYTIDATGKYTPRAVLGGSASPRSSTAATIAADNLQTPLKMLADKTGGLAVVGTDELESGLGRIRADLLTYYSIGYTMPAGGVDRVHSIEVQLTRKSENELRYRQTVVEKSVQSRVQDEVTTGLIFGIDHNPMALTVTTGVQAKATVDRWRLPMTISVPARSLALRPVGEQLQAQVILFIAARDYYGKRTEVQRQPQELRLPAAEYEQQQDQPFTIETQLLLDTGNHQIVIGLLDELTHQTSFQRLQIVVPENQ